ncbi:hypothetical protein MGWOODY_Smn2011 [hydrothermal vent metagenome]|uniref:Uncharacterized protein n=1 Tax=hydrothermal vent metagenome TaxID=652676 RepID=A0A160TPE5_9ZZZZ
MAATLAITIKAPVNRVRIAFVLAPGWREADMGETGVKFRERSGPVALR